jgi:hypothetical protein
MTMTCQVSGWFRGVGDGPAAWRVVSGGPARAPFGTLVTSGRDLWPLRAAVEAVEV